MKKLLFALLVLLAPSWALAQAGNPPAELQVGGPIGEDGAARNFAAIQAFRITPVLQIASTATAENATYTPPMDGVLTAMYVSLAGAIPADFRVSVSISPENGAMRSIGQVIFNTLAEKGGFGHADNQTIRARVQKGDTIVVNGDGRGGAAVAATVTLVIAN